MAIGNLLAGSDQQYTALKDETGTWRILDTWHEDLKHLDGEDEIPDTSDAVVVFSEGQFIALIKEAGRLGILANATFGSNEYEDEERNSEADTNFIENEATLNTLYTQLDELKTENAHLTTQSERSEEYELKEHALNSILKLVSMQDMANLSKD